MQVFVTGGTGLIGSAVVAELIAHDHTVTALARSESSAEAVRASGAEPLLGGLADLDVVRAGASAADGAIHLAFSNDFSSAEALARSVEEESAAIAAITEALEGSDRPFVVCSGTPWVAGRASVESDALDLDGPVGGRARAVTAALAASARGVRASAVRLPRTVHRDGQGGFAGVLTAIARQSGTSGYPGDGTQRWPAVHALDAAALFRLALEQAPAGTSWHAVGEEAVSVRDTAEVIGRRLGLPVEPVGEEAFGALGPIFAMDQPSSSAHTREALGWAPTRPDLLEDLENLEP